MTHRAQKNANHNLSGLESIVKETFNTTMYVNSHRREEGEGYFNALGRDISLTLYGIDTLDCVGESRFEIVTAQHIQNFFNSDTDRGRQSYLQQELFDVEVEIHVADGEEEEEEGGISLDVSSHVHRDCNRERMLTSRATPQRQERHRQQQLRNGRRKLDFSLTINYSETISYRVRNGVDPDLSAIIEEPFNDMSQMSMYVNSLKDIGAGSFDALQSATMPSTHEEVAGSGIYLDESINIWVIVGSVMGGLVVLFVVGGMYLTTKSSVFHRSWAVPRINYSSDDPNDSAAPPDSHAGYPISKHSVVTIDPDYENPHATRTISSSGGTIGDVSRHKRYYGADSIVSPGGSKANTRSNYIDDASFEVDLSPSTREDVFNVIAPPGKLGIGLDTPNSGAPFIYNINEDCPIAHQLMVGDQIIFVDDEDVRSMTAVKASNLICQKSANPSRKLTIMRNSAQ